LYPEHQGLLPWGNTIDGDVLYWKTVGPPDKWPTVIAEVKSANFETYNLTMTEFVRSVITEELDSNILMEADKETLFEIPSNP
jgi:hypothetical protein